MNISGFLKNILDKNQRTNDELLVGYYAFSLYVAKQLFKTYPDVVSKGITADTKVIVKKFLNTINEQVPIDVGNVNSILEKIINTLNNRSNNNVMTESTLQGMFGYYDYISASEFDKININIKYFKNSYSVVASNSDAISGMLDG